MNSYKNDWLQKMKLERLQILIFVNVFNQTLFYFNISLL